MLTSFPASRRIRVYVVSEWWRFGFFRRFPTILRKFKARSLYASVLKAPTTRMCQNRQSDLLHTPPPTPVLHALSCSQAKRRHSCVNFKFLLLKQQFLTPPPLPLNPLPRRSHLKETLVSLLRLYLGWFSRDSKRRRQTFTGICAIFDPNCHVVDQTVHCINKWQVVWKQQNHQCLPLRYV